MEMDFAPFFGGCGRTILLPVTAANTAPVLLHRYSDAERHQDGHERGALSSRCSGAALRDDVKRTEGAIAARKMNVKAMAKGQVGSPRIGSNQARSGMRRAP